jgi:hypothetical protein
VCVQSPVPEAFGAAQNDATGTSGRSVQMGAQCQRRREGGEGFGAGRMKKGERRHETCVRMRVICAPRGFVLL